jgi:hypothetical protein
MVSEQAEQTIHATLQRAVRRVLQPLVRILIRNGVDCPSFEQEVRRSYVRVAMHEFGLEGRRPTISRTATLTGLSRKEVARLVQQPEAAEGAALVGQNRAAAVVAGWVRDPDFQDGRGAPRPLALEDSGGGFPALVKRYSGDVPAGTVLDELVRVGVAERLPDGRVRLLERSYVPARDDAAKIEILGTDVSYLIDTISHNLDHSGPAARYQRKVCYDDVPDELAEQFRAIAAERCQKLLEEFDRLLARYDRGANPAVSGSGRRLTGVGMFYFEEDLSDGPGSSPPDEVSAAEADQPASAEAEQKGDSAP